MDAIETQTVERAGHTYRIAIYHDTDAPNPLEDWDEMGTILSLDRRQRGFDLAGIEDAITSNPDAVALSYFEHGLCRWSVAGEWPAADHVRWDRVYFAGLWLPDAATLESAANDSDQTRQLFLQTRAREACEIYSQWCNGDVYGYEIEHVTACGACGGAETRVLESCWGFYGLDVCLSAATAFISNLVPDAS